jgi:membrane associated rhomboid family serine protease
MFPLRDNIPSRRLPVATFGIIALNALIFLHELKLGRHLGTFMAEYAVVPARYTHAEFAQQLSAREQILPFISSMFLHGGWFHLIGNMWALWIFGDNVEDRLGRLRYLGLYLASGVAAAFLHILTNLNSDLPTVGASGAIAGVMGAYFRFYPFARVETLIPPFFLGPTFALPAIVFLGWWFLLQFFNGALSVGAQGSVGGVAWWAHVGGFLFGLLVCLPARTNRAPPRVVDI